MVVEITSEDRKRKAFDTLFSNVDKASWHSKCLDEFYVRCIMSPFIYSFSAYFFHLNIQNDNECRTRIMMVCLAEVEHRITTNDTSRELIFDLLINTYAYERQFKKRFLCQAFPMTSSENWWRAVWRMSVILWPVILDVNLWALK